MEPLMAVLPLQLHHHYHHGRTHYHNAWNVHLPIHFHSNHKFQYICHLLCHCLVPQCHQVSCIWYHILCSIRHHQDLIQQPSWNSSVSYFQHHILRKQTQCTRRRTHRSSTPSQHQNHDEKAKRINENAVLEHNRSTALLMMASSQVAWSHP